MSLPRYLAFGLLILLITLMSSNTNVFCQNDKLSTILEELDSNDFLKRQAAQNKLTEYLDAIQGESRREKKIEYLLSKIHDKKSSNHLKIGISYSIGRISTFFWKVKDQKRTENKLYELFKQTNYPTLKKNLDSALMKAKGLYWDAIWDYNYYHPRTKRIIDKTAQKFRLIFNDFPESRYASKAHYYLAKYYTRVYLIREFKGWGADKNELIAKESNSTYQNYLSKVQDGKYKPKQLMDAYFYFALNWVLLGKIDNAINELEKIKKSEIKNDYSIYVYEYYSSKGNRNVINRYFPSDQLTEYTIQYLKKHPKYNATYLKDFVDHLKKFEPV